MKYIVEKITAQIGGSLIHFNTEGEAIVLNKESTYEDVFAFAMKKFVGDRDRTEIFCLDWFSTKE